MTKQGCLIISLDFELFWGMLGVVSEKHFARQIDATRTAVLKMLELFSAYDIHATWATVGFLFFNNKSDLQAACPRVRPVYRNQQLSSYDHLPGIGENEAGDRLHYAASLIDRISATAGQEIASHTFSHYYCYDDAAGAEAFFSDLDAAIETASRRSIVLHSLVFPRNQCRSDYLDGCFERGILCYRGNSTTWVYRNDPGQAFNSLRRIGRFADSYINLLGKQGQLMQPVATRPVNLPATRFLRPATTPWLESLKLKRIKYELEYAAERGACYHLWWHPHNFGSGLEVNLRSLESILMHVDRLRKTKNLLSLNMYEAALHLLQDSKNPPPTLF